MIDQADSVRNNSAFFNGVKTIRAVATDDFKTIDEIRGKKDKIQNINTENYDEAFNKVSEELSVIINNISSKTEGSSNLFSKVDSIGTNIADAILEGNTTAEGLKKYLNKYGSKVKVEDTKPLENLIKEVANMPVNLFEAKPERSVRFDEVVGAVVPADIDTDLVNALEEEGIEVSKYESDEDRIDTVNRLADEKNIMFSIKDNGNNLTAKQYFKFGWATANGVLNTKEAVDFFDKLKYVESKKYPKSKDGDYIIEVGEKDGINNKLVYTNGDWNDPSIYKVVTINALEDETILDKIREKVYYCEKDYSGISQRAFNDIYEKGIVSESFRTDWDSYEKFRARRERGSGEENSREDRGLNGRERNTESDKKYSLKTLKQDRTLKKLKKKLEEGEAKLKEDLSPEDRNRISNENLELLMQIQALETKEQLANAEGLSKEEIEKFENDYKQLEEAMGQMGIKPMEGNIVDVPVITDELIEEYNQKDDISFEEAPTFKERAVKAKQVRTKSVAELETQIENLKKENERLAQETKLTHGKLPDIKDIKKRVNQYVRELMGGKKTSLVLVDKATNRVEHIYKLIKEGNYEKAAFEAYHAAIEVLEEVDFTPAHPLYDEYLALNEYLRTTPIEVSEQDKKNITDFNYIRKEMFGKIRIVNGPGNIDSVYEEMAELFPVFINSSVISDLNNEGAINSIDMFHEIVDLRRGFESLDFVLEEEEFSQLAKEFGNDLIEIAMDTKPKMTVADKMKNRYDSKVKKLKENFDKAIKEANEKMEKKFGDSYKKKIEKELRKDIRKEERIRANEKRDKEIQKLKEKHEKKENKKKDTTEHKKLATEIEKNLKWLSDRLIKPTDDKHIPEEFRKLVAEFLYGIDRQTARSKKLQENSGKISLKTLNLQKLQDAYESIAKEDGSGEFEYDGYIADIINATKIKLDGKSIDEADNKTLKDIKTITDALIFQIRQAGKNFNEELRQSREEIAKEIVSDLDKVDASRRKKKKNPEDGYKEYTGYLFGSLDKLLNEDMVTPGDFFELLGEGMNKLYKPLRKGFDKHVRNRQNTREMFAKTFEKYYNKKKPGSKLEKIRQKKSAIRIELENGYGITMTPAQIMSLYCLNKREQARGHIYGAGIVASGIESNNIISRSIGGRKKVQAESMQVTPTDVSNIISKLTDEQKAIADALMEYLNTTCADWGNEASMKLFGYKKFTEKNYFPIKSADVYLNDNLEARQIDEVIKNFGFTKGTVVKANNPIVIADIFEVVADHVNKMSLYNAFAVPIADFQRIYNYNIKNAEGLRTQTVRSKLKKVYGEKPEKYIKNFMVDLNNNNATKNRDTGLTRLYNKALANYKKAAIGFNLRVLVQQPTAIMRAMQYISPTRFVGISNPRKNLKEMREHCPIAAWKSWGYAQTDVARDIEDIMMNNEWSRLDLITMRPYGFADDVTWSMIWSAVKRDVKAKHKDVKVGSDEFWELCNEQASMIFDKTQVVDSPFHKSQIMRDKGVMQKTLSSFMAEPTRTFNMVRTEMTLAMREYKAGEKGKATKRMSRTIGVFVANAALVSAAAAVVDALRGKNPDKDDKEKRDKFELWMLNFFNNLDDNANPLNMIVGIKDIWQLQDGWGTSNMALEGFEALWKNIDNWKKFVTGEGKMSQEELLKETSEALGQVFGIPFKNVFRDLKIFFPEVFAAEKESETASEYNAEKNWFDKALEKLGIDDEFDKWGIRKKKSQAEREEEVINERAEKAQKEAEGLSGTKREQAIWSSVTKNYTNMIKDGDFSTLKKMKQTFEAMGEYKLAERLDEKIESGAKTAFKKSIGYAEESQVYRDFLEKEYGYKEGQFGELLQKSETAKDFQKYAIEGDDAKALQACVDLLHSGATEEDLNIIWNKRTKNIDAADYAEGSLSFPTSGEISSPFGNRTAPIAGASTYHKGIDISAPSGTDVIAADGGKVSRTGFNNTSGNWIKILHGNGKYTVYKHLNDGVVLKGDIIKKGQVIGHVGSTGISTGPHLHFELIQDGQYLDPTKYL